MFTVRDAIFKATHFPVKTLLFIPNVVVFIQLVVTVKRYKTAVSFSVDNQEDWEQVLSANALPRLNVSLHAAFPLQKMTFGVLHKK